MNFLFLNILLAFNIVFGQYYIDQKQNCTKPLLKNSYCYVGMQYDKNYQIKSCNKEGIMAFTYDDGPSPTNTPIILDILKKYNVKATFFIIGNKILKNKSIIQRMVDEGHQIGCHTYSHTFFTDPNVNITKEILDWEDAFTRASFTGVLSGYKIPTIFRAPRGIITTEQTNIINSLGYDVVHWGILSDDSSSSTTSEFIFESLKSHFGPGTKPELLKLIYQQHDTQTSTLNIQDELLNYITNYLTTTKFDTISSCIEKEPYRDNPRLNNDPNCNTGILNTLKNVCCSNSCGTCGGNGCGNRVGGANGCCVNTILNSGVMCKYFTPPCIM